MQAIREYLEKIVPLSEEDWNFFAARLEQKTFPKNQLLLKQGKTENFLSFIEKGLIRFYIPGDESDLTFAFCFQNEFVCAYDSFLLRLNSNYHIETLAETNLWRLTYQDLQEVYNHTNIGEHIGRIIAEQLFLKKSKREMSFLSQSAEERYLQLIDENPALVQQIPLKYIASYIGITPQALSRIRKRIS